MLADNVPRGKGGETQAQELCWQLQQFCGPGAPFHHVAWRGRVPHWARAPAGWTASAGGQWAHSLDPKPPGSFRQAQEWGSPFKCPSRAQRGAVDLVHPTPDQGPTAPQLFSICSISSSPSREQGLLPAAPRSLQARAGSPRLPQASSRPQPSGSSQHSSSLQAGWSSKEGGSGSGTGVPAGVLPPGPEAEAESKAVQDRVLLTWRAKGLRGLRSSIPELRQLRLLKVWQFCGGDRHRLLRVAPPSWNPRAACPTKPGQSLRAMGLPDGGRLPKARLLRRLGREKGRRPLLLMKKPLGQQVPRY